jgi:PleD family two-component response regulator
MWNDKDTQDSIIIRADDAMYTSKNSGKNQITVV